MNKETGLPKLGMHKFITIFYLPITIAFYFYVAVGNIYDIGRLTFTSIEGYIDAFILMFPFVTVILFTVALVGLLGLTHFGRRAILFSTTFRILMMLIIIFGEMTYGNSLMAALYTAACVVNILVFAYYRRRELYFVKDGQTLAEAYAMRRRSQMPSPVRKSTSSPSPAPEAETGEEKTEEEEKPAEEEKKDEAEGEIIVAVSDVSTEYTSSEVVKRCTFIYTPERKKEVNLLSASLDILKGKTIVSLEVENTGDKTYTESDWLFMTDTKYTSKTPVNKGKTVIKAEINQPVDRISITLAEVR